MLKRLWQIIGPVLVAMALICLLFFFYPNHSIRHSFKAEKDDAVALSPSSFKSKIKKVRALSDSNHRFVAFFGSSEWLRIDKMHPSVLAEAYHRNYTPYLLGQAGAASLTQYFGMQQFKDQLKNKQAVYVISPQWFVKHGADSHAFQNYFSTGQVLGFLKNQKGTTYDKYAAQRFLRLYPDSSMASLVKKVAQGKKLSRKDRQLLNLKGQIFDKEDALFSTFSFSSTYEEKVNKLAKELPTTFSYNALSQIATLEAQKSTTTNPFNINDNFFNLRIKNHYQSLKGSQRTFDYTKSPEYTDLQLVLKEFASQNTNVLFVIPPVNSKWAKYTGLNQDMYQQAVDKIKFQLQSQGFTNIADLSRDGGKPYFMQDTIHIGWNGWLALDKYINPFLTQKQVTPTYTINNQFLTKTWANYTGQVQDFNTN